MSDTTDMTLAQITELRRMERMRGLSDNDIVKAWYQAEDSDAWVLTPRQVSIRQRWDLVKAQFLKRHRYQHVCDMLVKQFGVSIATARRDISNALSLFGDIDQVPKQAHRQRAIEMALETFHAAKVAGDPAAMAKATNTYMFAAGLDKDDPDQVDIEKLMSQRTYVEVLDPALRELLLNFLQQSGGAIDTTKLFETIYAAKNADYVNYETIQDDAGTDPDGD